MEPLALVPDGLLGSLEQLIRRITINMVASICFTLTVIVKGTTYSFF
jgi:hypothetical protein